MVSAARRRVESRRCSCAAPGTQNAATSSDSVANIRRRSAANEIIKIPPRVRVQYQASPTMLYGFRCRRQNACFVIGQEISEHGGRSLPTRHRRYAAKIYPPRAAVISWIFFDWAAQPYFTLITTFVFAPYFATHVASGSRERTVAVGFCHRGRRHDDRAAVAGAGRDRRCQRPPQAVDRGVRRAAGDRLLR